MRLYFIAFLDIEAQTGIFAEETKDPIPETALKVVVKGFEERLNAGCAAEKSNLKSEVESILRFEQKFNFLLDSYCTESLWNHIRVVIERLEALIDLDVEAKPFRKFMAELICDNPKSIIADIKTKTKTKERILHSFCSYFTKNSDISKLKDILQTLFIVIESNREILMSLYEREGMQSFVESVAGAVIEHFKKLVKREVQGFLEKVKEASPGSLTKAAISHHGSSTAKLCELHNTRRNVEEKINALIKTTTDLIALLKASVHFP
eukprot:TRINITY_DN7822_c0_g3_i3.p1 TRINITY_DN7822_c0_g3~~TRINITY_DN7822_c0_g3_i3.p1  ORF type:complete len:265 (+),score=61.91 TRINITY_DN7822_c0_g3_i3:666-1460(+)